MTNKRKNPSYHALHRNGTLHERALAARQLLKSCAVCPHACGVNRLAGELGRCRIGARARVASFGAHFGEESPLVGQHGSGTIFFEGCNLHCIFCQNYDISHIDRKQLDDAGLAWRGLLVRHLVMPGLLSETRGILEFLAREIGKATYVNIMDQYRPCYHAHGDATINRPLHQEQYARALAMAEELGLQRLDQRDIEGLLFRLLGR
jgi:uncharacterized Fe-S radical SAM superfamily protein PflX